MNEVITNNDAQIKDFMASIDLIMKEMTQVADQLRPSISSTRFITDNQLSKALQISRRTLQEYRNNGFLPYYQLCGKILYKESDIEEVLRKNVREAWKV